MREGYVAFVEELPGANTQGETLEEARANVEEAVTMVLEAKPRGVRAVRGPACSDDTLSCSTNNNYNF